MGQILLLFVASLELRFFIHYSLVRGAKQCEYIFNSESCSRYVVCWVQRVQHRHPVAQHHRRVLHEHVLPNHALLRREILPVEAKDLAQVLADRVLYP